MKYKENSNMSPVNTSVAEVAHESSERTWRSSDCDGADAGNGLACQGSS
jgi:hypothetical protein